MYPMRRKGRCVRTGSSRLSPHIDDDAVSALRVARLAAARRERTARGWLCSTAAKSGDRPLQVETSRKRRFFIPILKQEDSLAVASLQNTCALGSEIGAEIGNDRNRNSLPKFFGIG